MIHPTRTKLLKWIGIASCCVFSTVGLQSRVVAAERIYASYATLERSISVAALEEYARKGKLNDELADYAKYVKPQQMDQLRRLLLARADLSAVAVSQFLYTPIGETLLERFGEVIQTEARLPGFYAIRAALILAASEPEGLTLLNVLHNFPTRSIRIDLRRSLRIVDELQRLINQNKQADALVYQEADAEASTEQSSKVDFSRLPDLRRRGRFTWNKQTLTLNDFRRARIFRADVYLPNTRMPPPVIVISHGLGSDRTSFEYLAEHLASYGFAVGVPEHPGSDSQQLRSLLAGRANAVAEPNEFINRPMDVKFLLDELQRRQSDPTFKVNLQQVGVIGQSFGGYTALALAGANLNFDQLRQDCKGLKNTFNVSLLLQCRALELPFTQYNLRDARIKAAIAINPIDSSVLGQAELSKIKIPLIIVSGSADTIAPPLSEQILPFTWLTTSEKYLVLLQGGTHFSTIGESPSNSDAVPIPSQVIGPDPAIARRYMNALSVAFFQTYVAGATQYRPYLSAAYAKTISQALLGLNLVRSLTQNQLAQVTNVSITNTATPSPK